VHAGEQLYTLVLEETPGAQELWDQIGQLHMRLVGGSSLQPAEAIGVVQQLRDGCTGPLAALRDTFEGLIGTLEREPWT
jgi:hypothetical protein